MKEVHEGICGNHSGARSLVHKLIRAGYYWPTMLKDTQSYVKAYDKCQRFSNLIRQPSEELSPMTAPWPFAQWGLDIIGPFLTALRQLKFLVVGIDYFTNGWKQNPLPLSQRKASVPLCGKTSYADTGFRGCLSLTMENNSTMARSGISAQS